MAEISVIVPVYNVKPYIERCLDSIAAQSFSDLEVILVDDGSTDGSGEVCDAYAANDPRFIVLHRENKGVSAARNAGLDKATGNYIGFVDSDDCITPDFYAGLRDALRRESADMAVAGLTHVYDDKPRYSSSERLTCKPEQAIEIFVRGSGYGSYVVDKLYKRRIFEKLRFREGIVIEDAQLMIDIVPLCGRIAFTGERGYMYMHRSGSITESSYSPRILDAIAVWEENAQKIKERFPNTYPLARMRVLWAYFFVLDRMALNLKAVPEDQLNSVVGRLRGSFGEIMRSDFFTRGRKLAACALIISVRLYGVCVRSRKDR